MLEQLEALRALAELGTTARAANRLRITQSAVSKRIAALEAGVGVALVRKSGRGLILTDAGGAMLSAVAPHLSAIHLHVAEVQRSDTQVLRIAATESLLGAWLPADLRNIQEGLAGLRLELHAHRGPVAVQRVRAGAVDLAVCVGGGEEELASLALGREPMVIVSSGEEEPPRLGPVEIPVWTIESASLTGAWLARRLPRLPWRIVPAARIESFSSAIQLARAGFGHALVPLGIARAMAVPPDRLQPIPGLSRPLVICLRPTTLERPLVRSFVDLLQRQVSEHFMTDT